VTPQRVVVFGTGDFARVAVQYLRDDSPHDVVAFTVDAEHVPAGRVDGLPVVPFENLHETYPPDEHSVLVAIGFSKANVARASTYERVRVQGYDLLSYVHSSVKIWDTVVLGDNCFVFENNVIQPNVRIGNDVVLWSGNHVGHDTTIGDHCFVASHAVISGNVTIGSYCFVGVNATIRDGVSIADRCVIGAGALIMRDTAVSEVYSVRGTSPAEKRSSDVAL
jgi:sugar O-acyltransferase (sialic acid O-acetyltransferase NeuD family)